MLIKRANDRKLGGRANVLKDEVKIQDDFTTLEKGPKLTRWKIVGEVHSHALGPTRFTRGAGRPSLTVCEEDPRVSVDHKLIKRQLCDSAA